MKRYLLSVLTVLVATTAVTSAAQARAGFGPNHQVSTPAELSEDATFHDLLRHNRGVRDKS
ncbi:hypothetical protein N836_09255 [Leptolyngbya sp. Heron Island J]|uniref:hypothetical protein n=1 Tax=Leptolyngbya sp. Heron Island J TaxID=1385935 RepID=UPI0003B954D8|nr:hypothetical protein [Leptolyngbya sp. Heron Island J]ESA35999.1 hypothetical protein N836_09255 [Leptolyngbya sp. Heron Island J]